MKSRWMIAVLVLAVAAPAAASEPACKRDGSESFEDCFLRVYAETLQETSEQRTSARREAGKTAKENVQKSALPAETPEAEGATADYLTRLFSALGFGELSEEEGSQTLSFNLSPQSDGQTTPEQVVLKLVRRDPELFESFVKAIPEAVRAERKESLGEQLEDFDDLELTLSVAVENGRFGRSFAAYSGLTDKVFSLLAPPTADQSLMKLLALKQKLARSAPPAAAGAPAAPPPLAMSSDVQQAFQGPQATEAALLEAAVLDAARAEAANKQQFQQALDDGGYFELANLVANQPQLHFEGRYRSREDLAGPDEWGIKATYEHGLGNVNGLRRFASKSCTGGVAGTHSASGETCYAKYLESRKGKIKSANRLAVSAEFGETDALRLELPDDGVLFELEKGRKRIGSLAWGRSLRVDDQGTDLARFDLEATFEDVSGDAKRQDRWLATGTFTQNVVGGNVLSLSIVYASKPEYLGEVDEQLSARVGLKFKLDKKNKD